MEIYTVSFFGHRLVERASEIEVRLEILLHDLITQKEYVEFLIGRDGEFDLLAASSMTSPALRKNLCKNQNCDKNDITGATKKPLQFLTVYNGYCNLSRYFCYQPDGMERSGMESG